MPNTYANPIATPSSTLGDRADRVSTPARTGAQHELAAPENTPSANTPAESVRWISGAPRNIGRDQLRPVTASTASTTSSTAPKA